MTRDIMQKIVPFLWFDGKAEEATEFYVATFPNSKVVAVNRAGPSGPVISTTFELDGQLFYALNGGPQYHFTPALSLFVNCETQEEVDSLWDKLLAGGGVPNRCGWLADRYGLSWQVIPRVLGRLLSDPDPARAHRAMQAMLQMTKIDIAGLQRAADQT
jgi:predicted 3-demethylubiquinone-9 3-methyltransferase (glyoxalase superfamily)